MKFLGMLMLLLCCGHSAAAELAIEEARYVRLGEIDQWITIRGANADAPVLLWIHGGPADVQSPLVSVYEPWTREFRFVQWDQRGAGRTFGKNPGPPESVSLERIVKDGLELVEHLQKSLDVRKVIIAGHSWGTLVAQKMVQQRPDAFSAFIGAGQVTSWRDTVKWQYDYALARARAAGDQSVVQALESAGLPPHDDFVKYFAMRRHLAKYFPAVDQEWITREQQLYATEVGASANDAKTYAAGGQFSGPRLLPAIVTTDLPHQLRHIPIRFCVVQGDADTFTPTPLARALFDQVSAPKKHFAVIANAGHFAPMTHGPAVLNEVRACLMK